LLKEKQARERSENLELQEKQARERSEDLERERVVVSCQPLAPLPTNKNTKPSTPHPEP
jgi:hypothetical protein